MSSSQQSAMQSAEEMRARLTEKAVADADFRRHLVADPKAVVQQEFGIEFPDSIDIQVHDYDPRVIHLALPPSSDFELNEEQLEAIAAGLSCCL